MKKQPTLAGRLLVVDAACVAMALGVSTAAYLIAVGPVLNARAQAQEQRSLIEEQARTAANQESLILIEQRKLTELERALERTAVRLAHPAEINQRLANITQIGAAHGLDVQQLDPGQATPGGELGKFSMVPIRIVGAGEFNGITAFLNRVLAEYPDVEVRAMVANAAPEGHSAAAFSIDLRWYAAPAVGAVSADAQTQK